MKENKGTRMAKRSETDGETINENKESMKPIYITGYQCYKFYRDRNVFVVNLFPIGSSIHLFGATAWTKVILKKK